MATTPSPPASRARTPPTPLHGIQSDAYEPYSPRRSKRVTAQANPYGSFNSDRSPRLDVTPPPTARKTRLARGAIHLSSPPSSPTSPVNQQRIHKTPRKAPAGVRRSTNATGISSDTDNPFTSLAPSTIDASAMLPTPSKTPKKRNVSAIASTARVLNFQPENPNDVMPTPRKMKRPGRAVHAHGFDLYEEMLPETTSGIQVFTDTNARIPELDTVNDNPFLGPKQPGRRNLRNSQQRRTSEANRMEDAVRNEEGVTYVFRGKKIFRRFKDSDDELNSQTSGSELGDRLEQRMLKRMAGDTARRPLTRSTLKPRLLFPPEQDRAMRDRSSDDVDEEALTDIDLSALAASSRSKKASQNGQTPSRVRFAGMATPPSTHRTRRTVKDIPTSPVDDEPTASASTNAHANCIADVLPKKSSPFDGWPRTKVGRKRSNDSLQTAAGAGKRTRNTISE